jgi:hypothetical protein
MRFILKKNVQLPADNKDMDVYDAAVGAYLADNGTPEQLSLIKRTFLARDLALLRKDFITYGLGSTQIEVPPDPVFAEDVDLSTLTEADVTPDPISDYKTVKSTLTNLWRARAARVRLNDATARGPTRIAARCSRCSPPSSHCGSSRRPISRPTRSSRSSPASLTQNARS